MILIKQDGILLRSWYDMIRMKAGVISLSFSLTRHEWFYFFCASAATCLSCAFFCAFLSVPPAAPPPPDTPDATFAAASLTSFNVFAALFFTVDNPSSTIFFARPISIGDVTADRACAAFSAAFARSMVPIGDAARSNKSITLADFLDFSSCSEVVV